MLLDEPLLGTLCACTKDIDFTAVFGHLRLQPVDLAGGRGKPGADILLQQTLSGIIEPALSEAGEARPNGDDRSRPKLAQGGNGGGHLFAHRKDA